MMLTTLWVYIVRMDLDLFFDHYFKFLSAKTEINKNELNLVNLGGLETLKDNYLVPDCEYG